MIKRTYLISLLLLTVISQLSFAEQLIQENEAHKYYGQNVIVEGTIVKTYNSGKTCFLNFHEDYKKHFTAVIFKSDYSKFPANPEEYYLSKKVKVTGVIKEYKGKPEIILKSPEQIKIIEIPKDKKEAKEIKEIKVISWEDADKYYGETVIVEGKIIAAYNSGKACFLNFHKNWKRYFTAVIFKSDFSKFPAQPEEYYKDKNVRIKGQIKEYEGKPEIVIKTSTQIEIIK